MLRRCYWFGPFRLDTERRVLWRGATSHALPERLYQILLALVEAQGELVTRGALAERVWGASGVSDTNLTQHIYLLRETLGERRGEGSYILTVSGRGYRLAAPVSELPSDLDALYVEASDRAAFALTSSTEALQQYCRGNYLLDRRTERSLRGAVTAFQASVEADGRFVPALVALARAWMLLAEYWHEPAALAMPKARLYVDRAVELDPRSAMALSALSEVQLCAQWDWVQSRKNLEAALTVDPALGFVRNNAAWYHLYRGKFEEAAAEVRQALWNEPASLPLQLLHARILSHSGRHAEAIAAMEGILALDSEFVFARRFLTTAYLLAGKPECALQEISSERSDASEDAVYRLPLLACTLSKLGEREKAADAYQQLCRLSKQRYVSAWSLAMGAASCGREDEAMALLSDVERQRDCALLLLPILPIFTTLERRSDFTALVRALAA